MNETVDVLVVGGGPTGVVAALLLERRGHTVRVLERAEALYDLPRAIVMDDEIQRVMVGLGLSSELERITTPLRGAEFVDRDGRRIMGVDLPDGAVGALGHPPNVTYYQPELEACLRAVAVDRGVDIRLGVEVDCVEATEHDAVATAGSDVHRARWLVAADGASSPIRKQLGIAVVDQGFDQDWLVLDVRLRRPVPTLPTLVQQICDAQRPTTFVVGHGDLRRWEFQLQPGETRDEMVEPDRIWRLLQRWLTPDDADLVRATVYRFHATVADRMRVGRVFLAGDAAHQMPPFLGQGLCSGVRDAANLAWKLDLVACGTAPDDLLDTYDAERRPHATAVVAHAVDTGRLIDQLAGREDHGISLDAAYGGARPFPRLAGGLLHGDHPAVGRQVPHLLVDGLPLDDVLGGGFGLLVDRSTDDWRSRQDWSAVATTVTVEARDLARTLPPGGAVVVRPDGYVAAVAHVDAELADAAAILLPLVTGDGPAGRNVRR